MRHRSNYVSMLFLTSLMAFVRARIHDHWSTIRQTL